MKRCAHTNTFAETFCPSAGQGRRDGDPLVAPLVQSTTFCREGVESVATHAYSRVSNPTVAALERALGGLEEAPPAVCFGSGLAAEAALFLAVLRQGDHVVCSRAVYGGTTRLLRELLPGLGVETSFVDTTDPAAVEEAVRPETRLIFVETPANPTLEVTDIAAIGRIARAHDALLAVDNTFLTAALQQPLDLGADVSVSSTTKYVEGHSAALGGAVVARDEGLLERLRFVRKCTGGIQAPFNAWLTLQGLKTLPLRLQRQTATAREVAGWLDERPEVVRVHNQGAIVSFELDGGVDAARRLVRVLRLPRLVEHVGSVETLITHPATMTHADVPRAHRESVGVTDGLLRLSVGLEPAAAIIADLKQGIEEVKPCVAVA